MSSEGATADDVLFDDGLEPRSGAALNPRLEEKWRFRCPDGHCNLHWSSRGRVHCYGCGDPCRGYAPSEIVDAKTKNTLEETLQRNGF